MKTRALDPAWSLARSRYLLLTTYRRDGTPVDTPVWFVGRGRRLYVWTDARSGKVRRIRADARVTVAACTLRGRSTGPSVKGTATVLPPAAGSEVRRLLDRRYRMSRPVYRAYLRLRRNGGLTGESVYLVIDWSELPEASKTPRSAARGTDSGSGPEAHLNGAGGGGGAARPPAPSRQASW